MFNYLFPIFCFGLVMTGIVFLGIIEAAKQAKAEATRQDERRSHEADLDRNHLAQPPLAAPSRS